MVIKSLTQSIKNWCSGYAHALSSSKILLAVAKSSEIISHMISRCCNFSKENNRLFNFSILLGKRRMHFCTKAWAKNFKAISKSVFGLVKNTIIVQRDIAQCKGHMHEQVLFCMEAISLFGITTIIRIIIHVTVTCSLFNEKKTWKKFLLWLKYLCYNTAFRHLLFI